MEIGVYNGTSLSTRKDYFLKGNIYGIDIEPGSEKYEIGAPHGSPITLPFGSGSLPLRALLTQLANGLRSISARRPMQSGLRVVL